MLEYKISKQLLTFHEYLQTFSIYKSMSENLWQFLSASKFNFNRNEKAKTKCFYSLANLYICGLKLEIRVHMKVTKLFWLLFFYLFLHEFKKQLKVLKANY